MIENQENTCRNLKILKSKIQSWKCTKKILFNTQMKINKYFFNNKHFKKDQIILIKILNLVLYRLKINFFLYNFNGNI